MFKQLFEHIGVLFVDHAVRSLEHRMELLARLLQKPPEEFWNRKQRNDEFLEHFHGLGYFGSIIVLGSFDTVFDLRIEVRGIENVSNVVL